MDTTKRHRKAVPLWVVPALLAWASTQAVEVVRPERQPVPPAPVAASNALSADAQRLVAWVAHSGDNGGQPFVIIDKRAARLWVLDGSRRVTDSTPVLLGLAPGDLSVPGIGERPIAEIQPAERTTPAGRFIAEPGLNDRGEDIFWVDYDAAVSMHRVRANNPAEARLQRLATPSGKDNRISYGCINVPAAFYDLRLRPSLAAGHSPVYILPERLPFERFYPASSVAATGPPLPPRP